MEDEIEERERKKEKRKHKTAGLPLPAKAPPQSPVRFSLYQWRSHRRLSIRFFKNERI